MSRIAIVILAYHHDKPIHDTGSIFWIDAESPPYLTVKSCLLDTVFGWVDMSQCFSHEYIPAIRVSNAWIVTAHAQVITNNYVINNVQIRVTETLFLDVETCVHVVGYLTLVLGTDYFLRLTSCLLSLQEPAVCRHSPAMVFCNYLEGKSKLNSSPQKYPAAKLPAQVKHARLEVLSAVTVNNTVFCHESHS
jgi:hypothetical protein